MQLIKSNDGLIGWKIQGRVLWCSSLEEAYSIGWGQIGKIKSPEEEIYWRDEVNFAMDTMLSKNHSLANFGVFGNFMYSELE